MTALPYLIARSDWESVRQRLTSNPEQASVPIPTGGKWNVYPIHQAVCNKTHSVPCEILTMMIKAFPEALDLNVFQGACENPSLSREAMATLLSSMNTRVSLLVEQNASSCASIALKMRNVSTVDLFINRYPDVLNGDILINACKYGTAIIVETILKAGVCNSIGKNGGLLIKNESGEDAFSIAVRHYDESDEERKNILSACLQYANTDENAKTVMPEPSYPVSLAAIGRVPRNILTSILKLNAHEMDSTDDVGKNAFIKAISMSMDREPNQRLPTVFTSADLINACTNGTPEMVKVLLEKDYQSNVNEPKSESRGSYQNALNIAISLYNSKDDARCAILKSCVQYANAVKMDLKFPSLGYPTILAAIGFVPQELLYSIGEKYQYEINDTDRTGKAALKVVLRLAENNSKLVYRLFQQSSHNYGASLQLSQQDQIPVQLNCLRASIISSISNDLTISGWEESNIPKI